MLLGALVTMLLLAVSALAADSVASGTCGADGDNLTWALDSAGTLTIQGSGEMRDYKEIYKSGTSISNAPWGEHREAIQQVVISGASNIGEYAFYRCTNLSAVSFAESSKLESIGQCAFDNCTSLANITLPDSVTSIGNSAFSDCTSLTNITLPDSVTSIGNSMFYGSTSLTEIMIPARVTSIGTSAFSHCTSLTTVNFAENSKLTNIGQQAFYGCTSLANITIPAGVTSIGHWAFHSCIGLTDVYITDINAWCRISFGGDDASPMSYAENIYLTGERIVSVDVPQSVASLDYTFYGFRDLVRVTIPDSVTSIGKWTFSSCISLTEATLPDSVTSIGSYAFEDCSSLMEITLPNSVTSIGNFAFSGCTSLTSITLPDSVTSIGGSAFSGCSRLITVNFTEESGLTNIGSNAFEDCSSLMSIIIPSGLASIGSSAFSGCTSLTSITIPDGVTSIGSYAFEDCSSLTSITIPDGVTYIDYCTFYRCSSLITVNISERSGLKSIDGYAFDGCFSLTSITIPEGVTNIGKYAFGACSALTSVHITDVGAWCGISFENDEANPLYCAKNLFINGMRAETLEIPADVKVILANAFVNAKCIQRVALSEGLVGIAANAFSGCTGIETVFYAGSESAWEALPIGAGNDCLKNAQIFYGSTLDDYYCRITVKISDGGCIRVDRNTAEVGDTITVTAEPYAGYGLTTIYVDGKALEGNTFTVQGDHEVSAVFTLLPAYGGTAEYRIEGITVCTAAGEKLQELMPEKLLVSVLIRHMDGSSGATVMLAQYDAEGRYQGLVWLTVDEMPLETALKVTLPLDNRDGKTINLKAFVVSSVDAPIPAGNAVSFGKV